MRFIQHASNNRVLGAPAGWDQKKLECSALPITSAQVDGQPVMISFWKPTEEELKRINGGQPIALWIHGVIHPPVSLSVEAA